MRLFILIMVFCMFRYDDTTPNQPAFSTGRQQKKSTQSLHTSCHMCFTCAGSSTANNCWAVLVTTPIMRQAQLLNSAQETIFVNSISSCDATQSAVTVLLIATKAGAVPIAVMIHSLQYKEGYCLTFHLLRDHYQLCFGNSPVGAHKRSNQLCLLPEKISPKYRHR